MKLNWFSPLPPAKTGIADYTAYLLPILQNYAEVVVWTDQTSWSSEIEQYASIRYYRRADLSWAEINQADLNIYHLGNNPTFHRTIWQVSRSCPGLVILHDLRLQHFFVEIYRENSQSQEVYVAEMMRYYGLSGKQAAEQLWSSEITIESIEAIVEPYPLTPLALANAVGVITHSLKAYESLSIAKTWLVDYAPLPYFGEHQIIRNAITNAEVPHRLIMFGHIGYNRRLDIFLEALSSLPEKNYFHLDIYGEILHPDLIKSKIISLGIANLVTLHGFVEEAKLDLALSQAELAINLRYPTMGEASLSQLRIWSHALPSLVTKVDWYAELPENIVAFIRPEHEYEDIQQQLQNLLANPNEFLEMGKRGKLLLEEKHNPKLYAQKILNFASKAQKSKQRLVAYQMVEKVGEQISNWSKRELLDRDIRRVAEAIHFISQ